MIAGESTEKEAQRKEKNMGKAKKKKKKNRLTVIEAQLSGFNEVIYAREQDYFKNYQIKLLKTIHSAQLNRRERCAERTSTGE